jgi:hypothetical protein
MSLAFWGLVKSGQLVLDGNAKVKFERHPAAHVVLATEFE